MWHNATAGQAADLIAGDCIICNLYANTSMGGDLKQIENDYILHVVFVCFLVIILCFEFTCQT